jgi:hypothetical protein
MLQAFRNQCQPYFGEVQTFLAGPDDRIAETDTGLKSKDEIPAEQLPFYVERDGAWVLDAEGAVEKARHDEMSAANIALKKELDDIMARFEGIDPDDVRRLAEAKREIEEAQQLKAGECEKVPAVRLTGPPASPANRR